MIFRGIGIESGLRRIRTLRFHRQSRCAGFTLLEVILALALSFLVLLGVGMAINLHLRMLDKRQNEIEQTQLSRSVLQMIRDDIRGAVQYSAVDTSALEELIAGLDPLAADAAAAELLESEQAAELTPEESEAEAVATSAVPPTRPGVYGDLTSLSIDVSRLPRRDQFMFSSTTGDATDLVSDIKTIAYYIGETEATAPDGQSIGTQMGLVRRVVDRASARYATDYGGQTDLTTGAQVVAPEITQILFTYFDGTDWLEEWDSDESGGLPVAIKVIVQIGGENMNSTTPSTNLQQIVPETHTMVVYLTISEAAASVLESEEETGDR